LLSYRGYESIDNIIGNLGCIFAIGVALFPTEPDVDITHMQKIVGIVHLICAALFFLTLTVFALFLFTKTHKDRSLMTRQKRRRNALYRVCGLIMSLCILLMLINGFLPDESVEQLAKYHPIFWLEAMAIVAFGVSWIVKGETLMKDRV
jgi:hypothetical protein